MPKTGISGLVYETITINYLIQNTWDFPMREREPSYCVDWLSSCICLYILPQNGLVKSENSTAFPFIRAYAMPIVFVVGELSRVVGASSLWAC